MLFYAPTTDHAWESLRFLTENFRSGKVLRGLHMWGASLIVIVSTLHILRVVLHGAYKRPRELNWLFGIILFLLALAFGFTGDFLRWDQKAYWATKVGTEMMGEAPGIGSFLMDLVRGGDELGNYTLTRFYAAHVAFLPALLLILVLLHIYLLRYHKVAPHPLPEKRSANTFPFYPFQFFRDSVLSLVVFLILMALALLLPAGLDPEANTSDISYDPRPQWYFLAHYELLRLFEGMQVLPIVVIPTLIILVLLALPWLDRSEDRHWKNRKGVVISVTALFALMYAAVPYSKVYHPPASTESELLAATRKNLPLPPGGDVELVLRGRRVFQMMKCTGCHELGGIGSAIGPSLNGIGSKYAPQRIRAQILDSKKFFPDSTMPSFAGKMTEEDLQALVEYVSNFK